MPPEVPERLETLLDKDWLSDALGMRFPGIDVTAVHDGPVVSRLSTNARFSIECAGGVPDGLSPNLCAKGYFAESQRALAWLGEPEARFYATIAEETGVRTLRSVYADVHPTTRHGVIITEDVVVEVFATAWRRRGVVPHPALPWLYATAANVIAHVIRSDARRTRLDAHRAGRTLEAVRGSKQRDEQFGASLAGVFLEREQVAIECADVFLEFCEERDHQPSAQRLSVHAVTGCNPRPAPSAWCRAQMGSG